MEGVGNLTLDGPLPPPDENHTQADFIKQDLNFDIDPNDPFTKASLSDHPVNEWMDILGSQKLMKKVVRAGKEDSRPKRLDICVLKLVGKLEDGTVVEEIDDFIIQLGDVEVIQGLDLALALMDTEEEAIVEVDARFGYGSLGRPAIDSLPAIPANARLTYDVTLKSVEPQPYIDELSVSKKREIGTKKKQRGNWWFERKEYTLATQCYRRALQYLSPPSENELGEEAEQQEPVSAADLQALLEDSLLVHNNLAASLMHSEVYDAALESAEHVLRYQPQNVKALYRKGKILHKKKDHINALAVLSQALKIDGSNKSVQMEVEILKKKTVKDVQSEKNLYRKMFGMKKNEKKIEKSAEENKKITAVTWSLLGGTIATIVGIVAYRFMS